MCRKRSIDELLADSSFIESDEYKCFQEMVDCGAYSNVKEAILSIMKTVEDIREEDRNNFPDEIMAAVKADSEGRKFPPLQAVANCIRELDFDAIPPEYWYMLADFLSCKHRAKKGEKSDREFSEQCDIDTLDEYTCLLNSGMLPTKAQEHMANKHRQDIRSIQRSIARGKKISEARRGVEKILKLDICRFFEDGA